MTLHSGHFLLLRLTPFSLGAMTRADFKEALLSVRLGLRKDEIRRNIGPVKTSSVCGDSSLLRRGDHDLGTAQVCKLGRPPGEKTHVFEAAGLQFLQ